MTFYHYNFCGYNQSGIEVGGTSNTSLNSAYMAEGYSGYTVTFRTQTLTCRYVPTLETAVVSRSLPEGRKKMYGWGDLMELPQQQTNFYSPQHEGGI